MTGMESREVSFAYADQLILDRVSLELRPGEVLVLLGANGAGKTTLLRALCRQLSPDRGKILLQDRDIAAISRDELARNIALMPQNESRDSPLRVLDTVSLGRAPHRGWMMPLSAEDREVIDNALQIAGLSDLRDRLITELSGGEWRRMILARALAQQAHVLMLDEPTAGLDLRYQVEVLSLIRRMARERNMIVVVTLHDLNHASLCGDRLALLNGQALAAIGPAEEVLQADRIEAAFGVPVTVIRHPVHGTPLVVPLTGPAPRSSEEG